MGEVRQRYRVQVASRNRAKKEKTSKTVKKNDFKNKYLGPEQCVLTRRSGPQNDGDEVGEVWEVRRMCCVPAASQNRSTASLVLVLRWQD